MIFLIYNRNKIHVKHHGGHLGVLDFMNKLYENNNVTIDLN